MHKLIMVLVYSKDAESALDAAHEIVLEKMKTTDQGGPFDYYVDFTESPKKDNGMIAEEAFFEFMKKSGSLIQPRYGKSRCGPLPPVLQMNTVRFPIQDTGGLEMVDIALENNRKAFKKNMAHIRYHISKYTDDQLFDEIDDEGEFQIEGVIPNAAWFRDFCGDVCGELEGPDSHLYDFWGRAISSPKRLQRILNDSDSNPWFMDQTEGQDPNWGRHIWSQPLWVAPFDVHY
jgi:hypothetical protein